MDSDLFDLLYESTKANVTVKKEYAKRNRKYNCNNNKYFTYALLLTDGNIYVGTTDNIFSRLLTHFEMAEGSSLFVKQYGPVQRILEITYDAQDGAEQERTLEFMSIFGHEKVRGSYWCRLLQPSVPEALHFYERGQMNHNFLSRSDIKRIEKKIKDLMI